MLAREEHMRVRADEALDPSDTLTDRRLVQERHRAQLRRSRGVRAAAQLARILTDLDDPDRLAVLLAEQCDRADASCFVLRRDERAHRKVVEQDAVHLGLDVGEHTLRHRAG